MNHTRSRKLNSMTCILFFNPKEGKRDLATIGKLLVWDHDVAGCQETSGEAAAWRLVQPSLSKRDIRVPVVCATIRANWAVPQDPDASMHVQVGSHGSFDPG